MSNTATSQAQNNERVVRNIDPGTRIQVRSKPGVAAYTHSNEVMPNYNPVHSTVPCDKGFEVHQFVAQPGDVFVQIYFEPVKLATSKPLPARQEWRCETKADFNPAV